MIKKITLTMMVLLFSLCLFACSGDRIEPIPDDVINKSMLSINQVDDIIFDNHDYEEIEIDNPDRLCSTFMDVDPDFVIKLQLVSSYLSISDLEDDVVVHNTKGESVELDFNYIFTGSNSIIETRAKEGYEPGLAYTFSIERNESLLFLDKDETVRKYIFTVKDDDKNELDIIDSYPTYDLNKVSHFVGYGDYDTYLYYDGSIPCSEGDIIIFSDGTEKIFIKVKRTESDNGRLKIHYECPEAKEMFNDMDLHIDHKEADIENDFVLNDINVLANEIANSEYALMYCYAIADKYNFVPQLGSFLDQASVNFSFKPEGKKFTLAFEFNYVTTTKSGWRIAGSLKFKWIKSFVISADAKVESFLGIPYDISMNCAVACDDSYTFQPSVTKKNKKFDGVNVEDDPKDLNFARAKEAVEAYKDRWTELDPLGYKKDVIVGDTIMINIGHLSIHLGYISVDIDVYACLKVQTDVTLGASYTYNSHHVLIDYSSSSGSTDGGMSPSGVSAHTISAYLAGKFTIEAYLKLRVTVYITGIKGIANLSVDGDAGLYLDITGLGTIGYDFATDNVEGNLGAQIDFGMFVRISLSVNLLYFIHLNWDLAYMKFPIFKLGASYDIQDRVDNNVIELNKLVTDIGETPLLTFNVFDGDGLSIITKTFNYNDSTKYFESIFSKDASYKIFPSIDAGENDLVKIENGKIIIDEHAVDINFNVNVYVKKSPVTPAERIIVKFHYRNQDAKYVSFDSKDTRSYLPGDKVEFPTEVEERSGYLFKGWEYDGKLYSTRSEFIVGDDNVNFRPKYVLNEKHIVKFYDGLNNLVYTTTVLNYDDVIPPTDEIRDQYMDGYNFICYDKSLKEVTGDLEIHAIYQRSE